MNCAFLSGVEFDYSMNEWIIQFRSDTVQRGWAGEKLDGA